MKYCTRKIVLQYLKKQQAESLSLPEVLQYLKKQQAESLSLPEG